MDVIFNKRKYYACYIYGDKIKDYVTDKVIGSVDELCGELENVSLQTSDMK